MTASVEDEMNTKITQSGYKKLKTDDCYSASVKDEMNKKNAVRRLQKIENRDDC